MKKKIITTLITVTMVTALFSGCGKDSGKKGGSGEIHVITREEGSGTRGAFIELMGIEQKDAEGNKIDKTVDTAEETNSTSVMITTVQGDESAIGYISLGSMDDSKVKAVRIDGIEATAENVKKGSYKVSRPFNIAFKDDLSDTGKDFVSFIMSEEGQKIVEKNGYITIDGAVPYEKKEVSGELSVGGSSSVGPVMEKLIEEYEKINEDVTIEIQVTDSSTGMTDAGKGKLDIGMASRELKDSELETGLKATAIAKDGVAVIVNKENSVSTLTQEQVMKIYTGEISDWGDIK